MRSDNSLGIHIQLVFQLKLRFWVINKQKQSITFDQSVVLTTEFQKGNYLLLSRQFFNTPFTKLCQYVSEKCFQQNTHYEANFNTNLKL